MTVWKRKVPNILAAALLIMAHLAPAAEKKANKVAPPDQLGTLILRPIMESPKGTATYEAWKKNLLETPEFWPLPDPNVLFRILQAHGVHPSVYREFARRIQPAPSDAEYVALQPFHPFLDDEQFRANVHNFVFVPESLKQILPKQALQRIYTYLFEIGILPLSIIYQNQTEMTDYFNRLQLTETQKFHYLRSTYFIHGKFIFIVSPGSWAVLSEKQKEEMIAGLMQLRRRESLGLQMDLQISRSDDIDQIARLYAGGRDPLQIARLMRQRLADSPDGVAHFPLKDILQPFIQKNLGTYTACSGPNCYNTILNTEREKDWVQETTTREELKDFLMRNFRSVLPTEPLKAGDVLVYFEENSTEPKHVAHYLPGEIAIAKNGFSKLSPYIAQFMVNMEAIYYKNGIYRMAVFRKPVPGEQTAAFSAKQGKFPLVLYRDNVPDGLGNKPKQPPPPPLPSPKLRFYCEEAHLF